MLLAIIDAIDVVAKSGIQFKNDELQKFATTMFIAKAKKFVLTAECTYSENAVFVSFRELGPGIT